ncbi:hypothetical protein A2Z33_00400 [Candidatus Gottesmanbacteria bacterium RBG_16_52_11]|uniref:Peptidase C39-like domain-containing protein n=1 Tax=Candidatus Gottesmanbacteria bacterium RBG_16_52_11 TaxID=1798374 RepID=A0A1F5YMS9_9BACT|nr:MAG: hypothetical protein A2Z33_00400 [Candidatus Gottesmanbacteria bacterium RBG_16_52_11]
MVQPEYPDSSDRQEAPLPQAAFDLAETLFQSQANGSDYEYLEFSYPTDSGHVFVPCEISFGDDGSIEINIRLAASVPAWQAMTGSPDDEGVREVVSESIQQAVGEIIGVYFGNNAQPRSPGVILPVGISVDEDSEMTDIVNPDASLMIPGDVLAGLCDRIVPADGDDDSAHWNRVSSHIAAAAIWTVLRYHSDLSSAIKSNEELVVPQMPDLAEEDDSGGSGYPESEFTGNQHSSGSEKSGPGIPAILVTAGVLLALAWGAATKLGGKVEAASSSGDSPPADPTAFPVDQLADQSGGGRVAPQEQPAEAREAAESQGIMLDVKDYRQNSGGWENDSMGGGGAMRDFGCFVTAMTQLVDANIRSDGGESVTPGDINRKLKNSDKGYIGNYYNRDEADAVLGVTRETVSNFDPKWIRDQLDNGKPLLVWLSLFTADDGHYSVIRGWYEQDGEYFYIINGTLHGVQIWKQQDLENYFKAIYKYKVQAPVLEGYDFSQLPAPIE